MTRFRVLYLVVAVVLFTAVAVTAVYAGLWFMVPAVLLAFWVGPGIDAVADRWKAKNKP